MKEKDLLDKQLKEDSKIIRDFLYNHKLEIPNINEIKKSSKDNFLDDAWSLIKIILIIILAIIWFSLWFIPKDQEIGVLLPYIIAGIIIPIIIASLARNL